MLIVQRALLRAEERYGSFHDVVFEVKDRQEALAKIYDYADVSVKYIMKYELGEPVGEENK